MLIPTGFRPLAAIVADMHLRTNIEAICERFLWAHNERSNVIDGTWNWMVRSFENVELAERLLRRLRQFSDTLISLGDHVNHLINENGFGERRARLAALAVRTLLDQPGWQKVIHVPSDHDIGRVHRLSTPQQKTRLLRLYKQFERTAHFKEMFSAARQQFPQMRPLFWRRSVRNSLSLPFSCSVYQQLFGPLWGTDQLGRRSVLWLSDMLVHALNTPLQELHSITRDLAFEQRDYVRSALAKHQELILCVHDPLTIPMLIDRFGLKKWPRSIKLVLAGHLHLPYLKEYVFLHCGYRFPLLICPSHTGHQLTVGGGLIVGERRGELRAYRCALNSHTLHRVY
jgi:hypothetical protein